MTFEKTDDAIDDAVVSDAVDDDDDDDDDDDIDCDGDGAGRLFLAPPFENNSLSL
jgi:hypothetical protein